MNKYGTWEVTLNNGDKYTTNASSGVDAFRSLVKACVINAPESAIKSTVLIMELS